jgi:hypothetical protein
MKPISATKAHSCDHCETTQVKNLAGLEETRYICEFNTKENNYFDKENTYKQACTIYDWAKCPYNEDK